MRAVQITFDDGAVVIEFVSPGLYWLDTPWFGSRHRRLVCREDLEDGWLGEFLELVDAA